MTKDEKSAACYSENFQQFRALNSQMNQVPVLAMTLTGGLWFGAGMKEGLDTEIRFALFMLAGFGNIALTLIVVRVRDVLESYLDKIKAFHPESFASGVPQRPRAPRLGSYSMITIFSTVMLLAAVFSFVVAFWKYWPFPYSRWWGVSAFGALIVALYLTIFTRGSAVGGGADA
jgi:hypothetical protein